MDAKQARVEYFEEYIDFEFLVRKLSEKLMINEHYCSLGIVIHNILSSKEFPSLMIKARDLIKHKRLRNGLAHKHGNSKVSITMEANFKNIRKINTKIKHLIKSI